MRRTGILIWALLLLMTFVSAAYSGSTPAEKRHNEIIVPVDTAGTYCNGAGVIQLGANFTFVDSGFLDMDNDCSNPFPWPYNDVFYRFTPTATHTYIFRLQLFNTLLNPSIRVMSGACCAGGISVTSDTTRVPLDCDSARATYGRALLVQGTTYWFHLGTVAPTVSDARFRFEMMFVECPPMDTLAHNHTIREAIEILPGDSIMGDSAFTGHPAWFRFTLPTADSVIITEVGREFGHCNTGFFPNCLINPLNAHFTLFCDSLGTIPVGTGDDELCSTDAQLRACLPAGTYFIKVENFGSGMWNGWNFILSLITRPAPGGCPDFECVPPHTQLCPDAIIDSLIVLRPDSTPFPAPQHVNRCVTLDTGVVSIIEIPVENVFNRPVITYFSGCVGVCSTVTCAGNPPGFENIIFDAAAWVFDSARNTYTNTIHLARAAEGCCVCLRLDFILPVELTTFTAIPGDQQITLNWATASEVNNDHFEVMRDESPVAVMRGAGSSAEPHSYQWTDGGLSNDRLYHYSLVAVDVTGTRQEVGTITAHPTGSASVITEYALRQNYPNPFNPSTQISFDLVESGVATLKVFNLMGQEVAVLVNSSLGAGQHVVSFDASSLPSGIYLYRLTVNGFTDQKKLLLLK